MSDRLALANAIEDAGIERSKASRIASVIFDAIHQNVATKADLQVSEASLRAEMTAVKTELKGDIQLVRSEVAVVRRDLARMQDRIVIRLSGVMVVLLGLRFVALRYLPPH